MSKYHAIKTEIDGYIFDSKAEARRYQELKLLEQAGEITDLTIHPVFRLFPAYTRDDGVKVRAVRYEADFSYLDIGGKMVVEDVKGVETVVFKLKRNMFLRKFPHLDLVVVR